jgi:hypothetical protein
VIEIEDGKYELIDGLQRLSSYFHFRGRHPKSEEDGEERNLRLTGCDVLPALNELRYNDLPSAVQIRLKRQSVRTEVLRRESDKRLRYYMFKRLNTGGEPLSDQEIRNCTIRLLDNTFNAFLKKCSENTDYVACMTELTVEKRDQLYMEEYVLRFFALKNYRDNYVKEIGDFLTNYMEGVSDPERKLPFDYPVEEAKFATTFRVLNEALGDSAFSGLNKQGTPKGYFSSLLFESLTIGLQKDLDSLSAANVELKAKLKQALTDLKRDASFESQTKGGGKNYAAALKKRIETVEKRVATCLPSS